MKKSILFNLMLLFLSWSINAQTATPPSVGDGTSGNPYEIATLDNLYWITTNPSTWYKHFIQTADIDASATITWNSGAGFSPIGNSTTIFIGSYNGNGYTISNFYINRPSAIQQGMFGITGVRVDDINTGAVLKKIGLVNVNIKGKSLTGGLVGNPQYSTSISECFVTGKVSGDQFVGGLVGYPAEFVVINKCYVTCDVSGSTHVGGLIGVLQWDCTIENSYATGKVIGTSKVGGLVGNNVFSAISNSYATGSVTGGSEPGGLVGRNDGGTVTNSFWDIETTGQTTSAGGTGKTTTEMKTKSTFTDAGWSFDPVWGIIEPTYCGLSYPYLVNNRQNPEPGLVLYNPLIEAITPSGDGSAGNPYQIATLENLYWIAVNSSSWDKYFIQTAYIDASATADWCNGGWFPIGFDYDNAFSGNYDGKGHSISGLYITNSSAECYGLFGHAKNAAFQNLGITDVYLEGVAISSGALLGYGEYVSINNCYSTGVVKGNDDTGGLVGGIFGYSILENSYSTCDVSGSIDIGGLVGSSNYFCSIINCFHTTGIVSSTSYSSGGLVGLNSQSLISKCFSTGEVMGKYHIGGLVGWNDSSASIRDCFSRCTILNTSSIIDNFGGLVGVNTYNSTINNCYSTGSVQAGMGGLVGVQDNAATTNNSFWDTETSGTTWSADGAGEGKYTSEMITLSTFTDAGWDFTTIWGINSSYNEGYPYLVPATLTLISGSNIQTACAGTEITPIVYTVDGFVAGVSLSPESPSGLSGIYDKDAKTFTISGTITDAGVYIFNVTTTGTLTPDIQATTTGSITVNERLTPSVTITSTDTDNIICVNTGVTFTATPLNTGTGNVAYQWYYYNKLQNILYDYDTWNANTWYSIELEDGDEIYCEITVTGGNCFTSLTATSEKITMEVYDSETRPTVKIESDAPEELCPGTNVTFTALAENTEGGIVSYQWYYFYKKTNTIYHYDSWNEQTWWSDELEDGDEVYCEITVTDAACFSSAVASSNKITISEIPYPDAGVITGKNVIQVGESVQFSSDCEIEGFWACLDENVDDDIEIASVDEYGMVTGNFVGTATIYYVIQVEKNPPCYFDSGWTGFPITVTAAPEINTQTFTSSGQFVVPDGVYSLNIKAWGGGGGGSYRYRIDDTDPYGPGAGGGGGGFCGGTFNVTPGDLISVTVGTGGSGGYDGTGNGDNGETSVIEYDDIIIEAYGGYGGKSGLDGGTAGDGNDGWYTGDIINPVKYMGGNGAAGFISDGQGTGGAGGGGAGDQAQGGDASGNTGGFGGNNGGGQGGSSGEIGYTYGGGGGGLNSNDNSTAGSGANGAVIIEWMESTCTPPNPTFTESPTSPQCAGVDVTYTTQADKTNYVWNIPGTEDTDYEISSGGTNSDNTVTLNWLTAGSKTVTVNYTEDCEGVTPASSTITVNPNPTLTGVTPSAWGVCIGGSVVFTASGLLDGPTDFVYTLTYDDNVDGTENIVTTVETDPIEVAGGVATFTIDASAIGAYYFELKSATINGCTTNFSNVDNYDYFVAYPQPSVVLVPTDNVTSICSGTETVLTADITSAGVGMNHIIFQKLAGIEWVTIFGSDEYYNISVSPTETTTYRAIYSTQGNGCNEAISENLTITVKPMPTLSSFTVDKANQCEDAETQEGTVTSIFGGLLNAQNSINLIAIENGNTAYTGDVIIPQSELKEIDGYFYFETAMYREPGSYQIILNSITANGCTTTFDENDKPAVSWVIHPLPTVNISGDLVACGKTTLTAETDATGVTYTWGKYTPEYVVIAEATGSTLEVTETGTYSVYVTNIETNCEKLAKVDVTINPVPVVAITGNTSIFIGGTTSLSPNTGGTWTSSNEGVAEVTGAGVVTGIAEGTATFTFTNTSTGCSATTEAITVTGTPPVFTTCPVDQPVNTDNGLCSAVVTYMAAAGGNPEPSFTYEFTGATTGSGTGTGTGSGFNTGETNVTITASNGILPDATCSFKVTVTDDEDPTITCAQDINQTADPGMCSADVTVVPPAVTDNCDNNVLPVSNTELIKNGNFNAGISSWQYCGNKAEVNTEEFYIVPLPDPSSNYVAEIDKGVSLCQNISGFTVGDKYVLTFKASRRQNTDTPNPVSANVIINGGALSKVVTRTNTTFDLTPETFVFTATQETHKLTFTPYTDNTYVLGFIVDDVSVRSITYPVGTTTLVWTATDVYGNTATCEQDITVADHEVPVITDGADIKQTADEGMCSAVVEVVPATATDNCGIQGSVAGTRSDAPLTLADPFPVGTTTITWTVSDVNGNPAAPVTQSVTVTDGEAPTITCAAEIAQTADQGMCSATVNVVPPAVSDNCDNHVLPVSNTELIKNGNFNAGVSNWQDCGNTAEVNTEEFYIVPLLPKSSNYVAEVDKGVSLCQEISEFTAGHKYVLTFKATRRQNNDTPNPVSANVIIDGDALSKVVTRTNTNFDLTSESFEFTATQATHKLTFTPYTDNTYVLGFIVDDVSIKSITYPVGKTTLVWTATDVYGNTATCEQNITVTDDEAPTAICKDIEVTLGQDGTVSIEENAVNNGSSDNCTSVSNLEFDTDVTSFDCTKIGVNDVAMTVTDECGNSSTCKAVVTILPYTATTEVIVLPNPQQYSDEATFAATVKPASVESGCVAATHVTFWVGTQQMGPAVALKNGTVSIDYPLTELPSYPSNGQMAPGLHEVKAVFSGIDPAFSVPDAASTLSITQENVIIDYIGTEIVGEANQDVNTTPVTLRATITDNFIDDDDRGDIRNARVRFEIDGSPISGWLVPTLVNQADFTQGIVSYVWNAPVPSSGYATYDITVNVGENGYYNGSLDDVPVNVYRTSLKEFITGGGHIIPIDSKGEYASDPGRKTNFGFNVKWNKTMKNLQGNFNLILRRGNEIYQIKSNALSSLGIDGSNPCSHKAVLTAKANLNRVTGGITENIMGNLSLQVTLTDNGEPGVTDRIGVTLYNGSTLLYSSSWPVSSTEELTLVGGNILVNDGLICNASDITHTVITSGKNPSLTGENVTFTATVYGHDATPQGTLVFTINGETFAGSLDSKGSASVDYNFGEAGTYEVEASYNSTNGYKPSTGTITQLVNGSSFILSSSKNPSVSGDEVTFTAVLNYPDAAPTGTVTFKVDGEEKAKDLPLADKKATFTTNLLSTGLHTIEAVYTSTNIPLVVVEPAKLTQIVNKVSISLASSKNPSFLTEIVNFTATVTGSSSVGKTVNFTVGGNTLSGIVDDSGNATVTTSFSASGTYVITATLAGESISASLNQVVQAPALVLTSSKNPSASGESVTFTATVTGGVEGGEVVFTTGSTSVPKTLTGGVSTWTTSFTAGSYLVTATYIGITESLTQVVNTSVPPLSVTLTASTTAASVVYGTNITFTATVNNSATAPSGTITFRDNNTIVKVVAVSGGKASFSTNKLAVGLHSITATYDLTKTVSNGIALEVKAKVKSAEIATAIVPKVELADLKVYPNPFSDRLFLEFVSPVDDEVRIEIFDITGRKVETVFNNTVEAGVTYKAVFIPNGIIDGIYLYRMSMGEEIFNGKVIFNRK